MPSYSMYASKTGPAAAANDPSTLCLGVEFYVTQAATLDAIRWWQPGPGGNNGVRLAGVCPWNSANPIAETVPAAPSGNGWQQLNFVTPVPLTANNPYTAVVVYPAGGYAVTNDYYAAPGFTETNGPLVVPGADNSGGRGQNRFGSDAIVQNPQGSYRSSCYWIDVVVTTAGGSGGGSVETFTSPIRLFGTTYAAGDALPAMSPSVKRSLLKRGRIAPASLTVQRPFKAGGVSYAVGSAWPAGADPKVLRRLLRSRKIG